VLAAVAVIEQLAAEVDFLSLGTNDLAQYVMAADRTNPRVAHLADALQPAVLRLIAQVVQAGHRAGIRVSLCGELAGEPLAASILLGLGLTELSMSAPAMPAVKQALARFTLADAERLAAEVLALDSAAAVRQRLTQA
jgi:phosphocarrier protein FPr